MFLPLPGDRTCAMALRRSLPPRIRGQFRVSIQESKKPSLPATGYDDAWVFATCYFEFKLPAGAAADRQFKFEHNVAEAWKAGKYDITIGADGSEYVYSFQPWNSTVYAATGYQTNGWSTAVIELSEFKNAAGSTIADVSKITDLKVLFNTPDVTSRPFNGSVDNFRIVKNDFHVLNLIPFYNPLLSLCIMFALPRQINIAIDAEGDVREISPYLYGRNNSFSSTDPNWTLPEATLCGLRDAGVRFFRESGGNNSSKYNWRRKLSSHPDWYNNVYVNNWDQSAHTLQKNFPSAQGMWAFPLLGYAAKTGDANFADWDYNQSQWWEGVNQNLAGGGVPNTTGTKAKQEGNIDLYLEKWNADSSAAILDHWFGTNGIGLKQENIRYWNMDNEPEIWSGTHDDVMPKQISAQEFMQRYIDLAKKAEHYFPKSNWSAL